MPNNIRLKLALLGMSMLMVACAKEQPPRSVTYFVDHPLQLEAVMVRCSENRDETRYDAECINARQAVSMISAREERARRETLEAQSERKREALWRTQKAAAEARQRAADEAAREKEAEYLAQFGESPPPIEESNEEDAATNAPGAVIPKTAAPEHPAPVYDELPPAGDDSNAPDAGIVQAEEDI